MDLPNYFIADLPDASTLSPKLITEACETLKHNRERFLAGRTTHAMIAILAGLSRDWLDSEFPFRKLLLEKAPQLTGFPRYTIESGLGDFFSQITRENLERLILQELGSPQRLDEIVSSEAELKEERASMARGPELLVHVTGGVLPNPTLWSMMLGLLVRSAQFVKCATGTSFIPRMFAHSLYAIQPKLGACLELAEWKGGHEALETSLFHEANCVTATGGDETLTKIRHRLPARVRFLGYGHRLSFAFVARESLAKIALSKVTAALVQDIVAWNQLGCLSPHLIYVETGGSIGPQAFAELLARELERRETEHPRGSVSAESAAAIATRRMFYEVRAADQNTTKIWSSSGSTAWTVVYEEDPQFQTSCLNRFIFVKPVTDLNDVVLATHKVHSHLSTVGLSAPIHRAQEIAQQLARCGVTRVCQIGRMQNPPLTWRHDGRPSLGDLVTWTDFELP
ncbi:MAG TPA: acyl-CoA reductase [Verrucomicrobiae bacterium]|nr:acyl-CoA reductase [Verrucomicrobiae bacterium]